MILLVSVKRDFNGHLFEFNFRNDGVTNLSLNRYCRVKQVVMGSNNKK